jgi:ribosomal protein S27E
VIKKERQQVNVLTQNIVRTSVRHVVYDCGHTKQKSYDTPKSSTTCYECGKALAEKELEGG